MVAICTFVSLGSTSSKVVFSELCQVRSKEHSCQRRGMRVSCSMQVPEDPAVHAQAGRRQAFASLALTAIASGLPAQLFERTDVLAASLPKEDVPKLCDAECEKELETLPMVTTESGLQYKDIKVGIGPSPPIGYQVAANYVAMIPSGDVFDSSLKKGLPYIFRVGSGQVIKGLDEGILSMKVGGKRRLYIPGPLAFPKGLSAAAGRPRVLPSSPVVFDVSLEYIPGLDDVEE